MIGTSIILVISPVLFWLSFWVELANMQLLNSLLAESSNAPAHQQKAQIASGINVSNAASECLTVDPPLYLYFFFLSLFFPSFFDVNSHHLFFCLLLLFCDSLLVRKKGFFYQVSENGYVYCFFRITARLRLPDH